jgi:Ca2+-binding RTX toxin-like protein
MLGAALCAAAILSAAAHGGGRAFSGPNGQVIVGVQWPAKLNFGGTDFRTTRHEVCGVGPGTSSRRWTVSPHQVLAQDAAAQPGRPALAVTLAGTGDYLALVDATHRVPRRLRSGGAPAWSPDGRSLLYVDAATTGAPPSAPQQVFVLDVGSGAVRQLTSDPANALAPRWSPDGQRIAYVSTQSGSPQVWEVAADGAGGHALTTGPGESGPADWSPDGTRLVFASDRSGTFELYTMNADGSVVAPVGDGVRGESPVWSPDGKQIAFVRSEHLHVVGVDGSGDHLAYPGPIVWGPADWAPSVALPAGPPCLRFAAAHGGRMAGTRFDDVLLGRAGADLIAAGAGADQVLGDAGNDTIDGGPGDDWLEGDEGADRITGGPGADHVLAGPGNDTILVRDGTRDWVSCGSGRDTVVADRRDLVARDCEHISRR